MAKVFIINDSGFNYSKAERFGELVTLTKGHVPIHNGITKVEPISEGLKDFNIAKDYLLIAGPPILNAMAAALISHKGPFIKVLMFDAKKQDYSVRHLSTN